MPEVVSSSHAWGVIYHPQAGFSLSTIELKEALPDSFRCLRRSRGVYSTKLSLINEYNRHPISSSAAALCITPAIDTDSFAVQLRQDWLQVLALRGDNGACHWII